MKSPALDKKLIDAAIKGNHDKVKQTLESGADIHAGNDEALFGATWNGHVEIVRLLLEHGANIHADNDAALRWAASNGHKETVELLLDYGADIHINNDWTLREAARNGHNETTMLLLRHGCDPKEKCLKGNYKGHNAFDNSELKEWLDQLKVTLSNQFALHPSREQCFSTGKHGGQTLQDKVLDACVTRQFATLIGAPLIASTDKSDRQLFQDIWDALPGHWQDQNQNIYMQFLKEGGVNPIVGQHTANAKPDQDSLNRRAR